MSTGLRVELLPGMHLVPTPAAPLLAAVLLGPMGGAVAGAVAGLGTVWLWGHGYALTLLALEGVCVGILRRRLSPVVADTVYWPTVGTWAALVVYGTRVGLDFVPAAAVSATLKVGANSLLAALLVHVALLLPRVRTRLRHVMPPPLTQFSVREMLRLVLACVVVLPLSVVAVLQAQRLLSSERARLADTNTHAARDVAIRLERELRGPMQATQVLAGMLRARSEAGESPPSREELGRWLGARLAVSSALSGAAVLEVPSGAVLANAVRPPATPALLASAARAARPGSLPGLVQVGGIVLAVSSVEDPRPGATSRLVVASIDVQQLAAEAFSLLQDDQRVAVLRGDGRSVLEAPVEGQRLVPDPQLLAALRLSEKSGSVSEPHARAAVVQALGRLHFGAATTAPLGWRVVVATPEAALLPGLHAETGRMLLGLMLALLLALVGGEALGRLITRPFGQLAAVAGRLARGERQARLGDAVAHGPQEVAVVGRAFDTMADALAEQLDTQQRAHARLQAIIDTIPTGLLMLDENGVAVENEHWTRTWAGHALRADGSLDYGRYKGFHSRTGEPVRADEWPCFRSLKEGAITRDVLMDIERFDGRRGTILVSSAPIRDASGRVIGAVAANMDITELRAAQARLQEADRRKDEFLGMLSHELRNPLAPIRNSLYILDHADPTSAQARRAREIARRQVTHMTRLVDDLLDVTRIARGKIALRKTELDLSALARRTADDHRPLMHDRGLELELVVPPTPVLVNGDETRLAQVLGNLLHNASKFTPAGGKVTLAIGQDGGSAVVHVRDTGVGMDAETLSTIFEPFVQAKQSIARSEGGLGLGLALVKGLVTMHGGEVAAVSAGHGRGTVFRITLPLERRQALPAHHAPDGGEHVGAARRRILVVDDNHDAAESLAELLEMGGHEVAVAHDGPGAVASALANRPDVILCDIGLPGMDGYEVARRVRASGAGYIRLVAVSGYAQPEDVARATEAGFDAHVAKPADPERLGHLLH